MSTHNRYFLIPLPADGAPTNPALPVWFVTWSEADATFAVTAKRPDKTCPWAVCATTGTPKEMTSDLGNGGKDIPPPEAPPLTLESKEPSKAAFETAFRAWLTARSFT